VSHAADGAEAVWIDDLVCYQNEAVGLSKGIYAEKN